MTKRIAIVGTGISGLTCAHLLHKQHDVSVFEANDYIGGHTHTVEVTPPGLKQSFRVDTGFIVYNDWTYPNFIKLMNSLGVAGQPTEMSFSVTNKAENLEYNGNNLNTLFAQRRNLIRPKFHRIVRDILRFNRLCKENLDRPGWEGATLQDFITEYRLSDDFANNYILPMCAAIWSSSLEDVKAFPLRFFLQFFNNHGLLNINERPQWHTIIGGSSTYIGPLTAGFEDRIHLNSPVTEVRRADEHWDVEVNGQVSHFDDVIFACHSDQALAMLADPSGPQQQILGDMTYADNDVVLHTDIAQLPKRKLAWASWNYGLKGGVGEQEAPAVLTYNMNILQRLEAPVTFCVTLNNTDEIDPSTVLARFTYAHPQFNQASINAQQRRDEICGIEGLHFCGAYWYNGFHEDGVRSALDVCQRFGAHL